MASPRARLPPDGLSSHHLSKSSRRGSDAEETRVTARTLVLKGHSDPVSCLATLDGGRLASGSWDNSVVIWSQDGTQLAKLEGHRRAVWSLAALDHDRLASGSRDNSVIIWSFEDG